MKNRTAIAIVIMVACFAMSMVFLFFLFCFFDVVFITDHQCRILYDQRYKRTCRPHS